MREAGLNLPVEERRELDKLHQPQVAILDAGSQFCAQIDRNIREMNVSTAILPIETSADKLLGYKALVISGGPDSVTETGAKQCDPEIFNMGKPTLGICYGMQLMAHHLGGRVEDSGIREDGKVNTWFAPSTLFQKVAGGSNQDVWMSHGDSVTMEPPGFSVIGDHEDMIAAIADEKRKLYGLQFHPEVDHTPEGTNIISSFLFDVAHLEQDFTPSDQIEDAIAEIQEVVGDRSVVMYLSGGVDSTVLALLMAKAIPEKNRIHAFHIDTGFMRADESAVVQKALESQGISLKVIDAEESFLNATTTINGVETSPLSQVTDPQVKRQIIGDAFAVHLEQLIEGLGIAEDSVLAQGTLRPDILESGSHLAGTGLATIKTHHNDTAAIRTLRDQGRVSEPIKGFYKDQVREIGRRLGLPEEFVMRQPFPGSGLAIRVICNEGGVFGLDEKLKHQDALNEFLTNYPSITGDIMPFQTVGVQGDGRSYKALTVLHSHKEDVNWQELIEIADLIPRTVHGVNRVAYAFKNRVPAHEPTPTFLGEDTLKQLRHADAIVRAEFTSSGLDYALSQVPVILAPVSFGTDGGRSIALRPFSTRDFMTGKPAVPGVDIPVDVLSRVVDRLLSEVPGITQVLYDLSSKPPATTEWE